MFTTILYILGILISFITAYFIATYINNRRWEKFIKEVQSDLEENYYTIKKEDLNRYKEWVEHHTFD